VKAGAAATERTAMMESKRMRMSCSFCLLLWPNDQAEKRRPASFESGAVRLSQAVG
jgi:hypothetical protein